MAHTKLSKKQDTIIEAALALLSKKGFSDLSLRDIARHLGIQAPAIYYHFKNKAQLVDYMAEYILHKELGECVQREEPETWQHWVIAHMVLLRKAMLAYPDGGRIVAGAHLFPAVTLAQLIECTLVSMTSAGVDLQTAGHILLTITRYTFGYVIEEQSDLHLEQDSRKHYRSFPTAYPTLTKISFEMNTPADTEKNFLTGLDYIIKGASQSRDR
jgi:TetR/AcrR family tetracycline transcriptional repressor